MFVLKTLDTSIALFYSGHLKLLKELIKLEQFSDCPNVWENQLEHVSNFLNIDSFMIVRIFWYLYNINDIEGTMEGEYHCV